MSGTKRRAEVPRAAQALGEVVSKADLLEAAWHLASLAHDGGVDDEAMTLLRLREELDNARERQGRRVLRAPKMWEQSAIAELRGAERLMGQKNDDADAAG